jgi:hypothetical protein
MKYLEKGGFQSQPLMRLTLGLTLALILAFWVTNFALYFSRMGLDPASVVAYYNGSEAEFRAPRSAASMLETTHMHLPMMAMVLLLLTHLALFLPLSRGGKTALVVATFLCAVASEAGGWLVRFVSVYFAPLKVGGFLGLQAAILFLLASLAAFLWKASRAGRSDAASKRIGLTPEPRAAFSARERDAPPPTTH